jgi:ParB/Sulfiredoxin domain
MTVLRAIDAKPFAVLAGALPACAPGAAPQLRWIEIDKLAVDPAYQREIGRTGQKNIIRIAREFEWALFSPVIVAPAKEQFVIVDGQHRTTAAAIRGHKKVPCQIISADQAKQAAAFAAINANVTGMSPMQLHAAKLAAADPAAVRLNALCSECGVTVLRYPILTSKQKPGETMAPGALYRMLARFGEDVLRPALLCVTKTRDGYPGFLRSPLISALCMTVQANPAWRITKWLLPAVEKIDLREIFAEGFASAKAASAGGAVAEMVRLLTRHLNAEIRSGALPAAAAPATAFQKAASSDAEKRDTSNGNVKPVSFNGVTVDSSGAIRFGNRKLQASPREALFVGHLARGFGCPISHDFLIKRVWARSAVPHDPDSALNLMADALAPRLAGLGLEIKVVKGAGIVLRETR